MTQIGDSATPHGIARLRSLATLFLTLLTLALVGWALPATASASDITFAGVVLENGGSPSAGTTVSVTAGGATDSVITGQDGSFQLSAVAGRMTIKVIRPLAGSTWTFTMLTELFADKTDKVFQLPEPIVVAQSFRSAVGDPLPSGSVKYESTGCVADTRMTSGLPWTSGAGLAPWTNFPLYTWQIPDAQITDGRATPWQTLACDWGPNVQTDVTSNSPGFFSGKASTPLVISEYPGIKYLDVPVRAFSSRVTDDSRIPIGGQKVELSETGGGASDSAVTDVNGIFQLDLDPGHYDVKISGILGNSTQYELSASDGDFTNGIESSWFETDKIDMSAYVKGIRIKDEDGHPVAGAYVKSTCDPAFDQFLDVEASGTQCVRAISYGDGAALMKVFPSEGHNVTVRPPAGAYLKPKTVWTRSESDHYFYPIVTLESSDTPYVPDVAYDLFSSDASAPEIIIPPFNYDLGAFAPVPELAPPPTADVGALKEPPAPPVCATKPPAITSAPKGVRLGRVIRIGLHCLTGGQVRVGLTIGSTRIGGLKPVEIAAGQRTATISLPLRTQMRLKRYLGSNSRHRGRVLLTPVRDGTAGTARTIMIRR